MPQGGRGSVIYLELKEVVPLGSGGEGEAERVES